MAQDLLQAVTSCCPNLHPGVAEVFTLCVRLATATHLPGRSVPPASEEHMKSRQFYVEPAALADADTDRHLDKMWIPELISI